jgi:UDPglucose 6-dehydrogenase
MRISVIGTGYLGATHAACLAELGFEVLGVDSDPAKVVRLNGGAAPFSEPGLDALLARHVGNGRLRFTGSLREAAAYAEVHFLCVGTPQSRGGWSADLGALFGVARELAAGARRDCLVVGKSTVPVGTAEQLATLLDRHAPPGVAVRLAWNPEFLREGHAVADTLRPDRLVFGVADDRADDGADDRADDRAASRAEELLRAVYADAIGAGCPVHVTGLATAELAKVAANSFLATKISFINAMADVSDRAGADVVALADILGDDVRIGRRFLDAGVGYGGGCLPKDVRALAARAEELGAQSTSALMRQVDAVNLEARQRTVDLAVHLCGPRRKGQRVAVLGASFKPLSDDVRDSPALAVAEQLRLHGADVRVHDPEALHRARAAYPDLTCVEDVEAALSGADLVLHLTEWPQYRELDPARAARLARNLQLVDGRNKLDHARWRAAGWAVTGLGRGATSERHAPRRDLLSPR